MVLILCTLSDNGLYLYKVSWKYSWQYGSYRADTIFIAKISKGYNSVNNVDGVTILFSAYCLIVVYISRKFHEIILSGIKVIERTGFSLAKFQRAIIP